MAEPESLVRALAKALAWPAALAAMFAGLCGVIAYRYYEPDPVRVRTSDLDVDPPYAPSFASAGVPKDVSIKDAARD